MRRSTITLVGSLSTLLLCTVFLAGPSGESHYLLLLIPGAIMAGTLRDRITSGLLLLALFTAGYSAYYLGGRGGSSSDMQIRCVVIELLLFGASLRVLHCSARSSEYDPATDMHTPDETIETLEETFVTA